VNVNVNTRSKVIGKHVSRINGLEKQKMLLIGKKKNG
jgi:hypothetical protein